MSMFWLVVILWVLVPVSAFLSATAVMLAIRLRPRGGADSATGQAAPPQHRLFD